MSKKTYRLPKPFGRTAWRYWLRTWGVATPFGTYCPLDPLLRWYEMHISIPWNARRSTKALKKQLYIGKVKKQP